MAAPRARRSRRRATGTKARAALGLTLLASVGGSAGSAQAYVRYKAADGSPYAWTTSCVQITGYPQDFPDMTADEVLNAASAAAQVWTELAQDCTYLSIGVELSSKNTPTARRDFRNSLIFRHVDWCSPADSPWTCSYDPSALAITTVFTNGKDGQIQDADIEVNSRWWQWADLVAHPDWAGTKQDLQNALTHEFGHLIGLDHTCYNPGSTQPTDNTGAPVPSCNGASAAVRATTMFASAIQGDLSKRTLEADDKQAVCDIYPLSRDPASCPDGTVPRAGCSVTSPAPAGRTGPWSILTVLLGLSLRRRGPRARRARR
jgi:hypothetical protein